MSETTAAASSLRLTNDFIFKYVFGRAPMADVLLDFVNAVLTTIDAPLATAITYLNPVRGRNGSWIKESILDVRAVDGSGRQFDIEVQVAPDRSFIQRSYFYWAQLYSEQLERGEEFEDLRPVVFIAVLDHELFAHLPGNHQPFRVRHDWFQDEVLADDLMLHYIELGKPNTTDGRLGQWIEILRREREGSDMATLIQNDPIFERAHEAFLRCTEDRRLRAAALSREMFLHDRATREGRARREGLAEGIEEGEHRGRVKAAAGMKRQGIAPEVIMEATGLSRDELDALPPE